MLSSIQLREEDNTTLLSMPIGGPTTSRPFFIKRVAGLDPVTADVITTPFAAQDGSVYNRTRVGSRNIVLTLGFLRSANPEYSISNLRDRLYGLFFPRSVANLVFVDARGPGNDGVLKIQGYVESMETDIFSQSPEIQISIICPDPYFSRYTSTTIDGVTGSNIDTSMFGTAPSGFLLDMTVPSGMTAIKLETDFTDPLRIETSVWSGYRLRVSTVLGNKYVRVTNRDGVTTSRLDDILSGSLEMAVHSRTSRFRITKESVAGYEFPFTIYYTPKYVGM